MQSRTLHKQRPLNSFVFFAGIKPPGGGNRNKQGLKRTLNRTRQYNILKGPKRDKTTSILK